MPNNTTMYAFAFWKTLDGPMVIEIPPTNPTVGLFGTMMDIWQRPVIDVGGAGFDKGLGGKYLLLPPNYNGPYPAGYFVFPQQTYNGWFALRAIVKDFSPESLAAAETLLKKIKIYPLSAAQHPPVMRHVAVDGKLINGVPAFNLDLFRHINDLIQVEPAEQRDRTAFDMLKYIGIKKGAPFNPTDRQKGLLTAAVKEANWVPLAKGRDFVLLFRLYGPQSPSADKSWKFSDFVQVDSF